MDQQVYSLRKLLQLFYFFIFINLFTFLFIYLITLFLINPFVTNALFLYPLKISETMRFF